MEAGDDGGAVEAQALGEVVEGHGNTGGVEGEQHGGQRFAGERAAAYCGFAALQAGRDAVGLELRGPLGGAVGKLLGTGGDHAPDGNVRLGLVALVVAQGRFERGQRHLVDAHGTHQGVFRYLG